jgi:hypothetical protein
MRPAPVWEAASRPTRRTWLPAACVMQGAAAIIWCSDARESKAVSKSFSLEKLWAFKKKRFSGATMTGKALLLFFVTLYYSLFFFFTSF